MADCHGYRSNSNSNGYAARSSYTTVASTIWCTRSLAALSPHSAANAVRLVEELGRVAMWLSVLSYAQQRSA